MKSILITNHFLRGYSGSELAVYDLAREFLLLNYRVSLASFEFDNPLLTHLNGLEIELIDLNENHDNRHYSLIWAHHFTTLDACILDHQMTADHFIFSSLSPYNPLECPPLYLSELSLILANSDETEKCLEAHGIDKTLLHVLPNPVRQDFFDHSPSLSGVLRTVAVVSNHIPPEVLTAMRLLKAQGISVKLYGERHSFELITPEILAHHDVIISIGRTVQYGLAMGIPVYCYDRFGGPGYITTDNFDSAKIFNFSGRCCNLKKTADELVFELLNHYEKTVNETIQLKEIAERIFHLPQCIETVLESLHRNSRTISSKTLLSLMQRQRVYFKSQRIQIQNSLCWKLTTPLRILKKKFFDVD